MAGPSRIYVGDSTVLDETPDSGVLTLEKTATLVRTYRGPYALCRNSVFPRGTLGSGQMAGWVISKSEVRHKRGDIGLLTVTWEAGYGSQPTAPA